MVHLFPMRELLYSHVILDLLRLSRQISGSALRSVFLFSLSLHCAFPPLLYASESIPHAFSETGRFLDSSCSAASAPGQKYPCGPRRQSPAAAAEDLNFHCSSPFRILSLKILLRLPVSGNRKVSDWAGKFLSEKALLLPYEFSLSSFYPPRFFKSVLKTERICPAAKRNRSFFRLSISAGSGSFRSGLFPVSSLISVSSLHPRCHPHSARCSLRILSPLDGSRQMWSSAFSRALCRYPVNLFTVVLRCRPHCVSAAPRSDRILRHFPDEFLKFSSSIPYSSSENSGKYHPCSQVLSTIPRTSSSFGISSLSWSSVMIRGGQTRIMFS